jgi:hypothetical protein
MTRFSAPTGARPAPGPDGVLLDEPGAIPRASAKLIGPLPSQSPEQTRASTRGLYTLVMGPTAPLGQAHAAIQGLGVHYRTNGGECWRHAA